MPMQSKLLVAATLAALGLAACARPPAEATTADTAPAAESAMPGAMPTVVKYKVVFTPAWTKPNFPNEYPDTSLIHKPHFSGWIGTAHNEGYAIFKDGAMPTTGLETLSETGKHAPLDAEIRAAIAAGTALELSESEPLKDFTQAASFEVVVDNAHPWASAVAMIAPSPDWFAAVDVNLMENGAFVASKTVEAMAWDSGGDDGTTYLASDVDTDPKKPSMASADPHFMKDGKTAPVGTLTFTKL